MYNYIKSSIDTEFEMLDSTSKGYFKKLVDESGNTLYLQIKQVSLGWYWVLEDIENNVIADSGSLMWETPQETLDDFNDWVEFNQ